MTENRQIQITSMPEDKLGLEHFDLVVAGHTDDVPIKKAATKAKHPTNWHLSVHRAISVANVKVTSGGLTTAGLHKPQSEVNCDEI